MFLFEVSIYCNSGSAFGGTWPDCSL